MLSAFTESRAGVDLTGTMSAEAITEMIPDAIGLNLMKHAYSEFTFLSRFLLSLYVAAKRESEPIPAAAMVMSTALVMVRDNARHSPCL